MEEDQDARFHDDHSQRNLFVDREEYLANRANTKINNSNSNTKNVSDDDEGSRRRLCIKFKVTSTTTTIEAACEDNKNNNNNKNDENDPKVCHICSKTFGSGKALGGHMRVHSLSSKKAVHEPKQKPKNNMGLDLVTCDLCKRCFPSKKSLFGHMRSHPERVRRGIQPPPISTTTPTKDSNSTFDSTLLKGWSVTAKRGRRSLSSSCSKTCSEPLEHDDEIEQNMQELEAVNELMFLANWKPKSGFVSSSVSLIKKLKIEEKQLPSYEEGSVLDSHDSVGRNMSERNKNSNKKKKGTKKMKLTDLGKAEKKNNLDNGAAKRCIKCSTCNKSFSNHQALGGHLRSHRESKSIQIVNESGSDGVSATEEEKERTTTMQVDHETDTVVDNGQNCPKILSFDLNQLPPMDDEEEGVQSELIVPADITASSSYASSSQNSVTHQ